MQEFEDKMPKEEFAKLKDDSANFSLENLDGWKNKVQVGVFGLAQKLRYIIC